LAAAALALDLWSKHWIFANMERGEVRQAIPSVLSFQQSINPGALFGFGPGLVWVFIIASFVALGFVLYLFISSSPERRFLHLALSCILAGSLGNLYDRTFVRADKVVLKQGVTGEGTTFYGRIIPSDNEKFLLIGQGLEGDPPLHRIARADVAEIGQVGVVRDFLKFQPRIAGRDIWPWVFNVADSLLVIGVSILMLSFWQDRKEHRSEAERTSPTQEQARQAS